jgi:hypothetical protein
MSTCTSSKQRNLLLKSRPKQVLGYLTLAFALPAHIDSIFSSSRERLSHQLNFMKTALSAVTHTVCGSSIAQVLGSGYCPNAGVMEVLYVVRVRVVG